MRANYKELFLTAQSGIYFLVEANNTIFDRTKNSPNRSGNPFVLGFKTKDCNVEQE